LQKEEALIYWRRSGMTGKPSSGSPDIRPRVDGLRRRLIALAHMKIADPTFEDELEAARLR